MPVANTMKRRSLGSRLSDRLRSVVEFALRNTLAVGLATMATTLLILFFVGLSILSPSSPGSQIRFSDAVNLIKSGDIKQATLLDQDARLEMLVADGQRVWTSYPHADPFTANLLSELEH